MDHHHALLLCWKTKSGFSKGITAEEIKKYSDWFHEKHLAERFKAEEKYLFTIFRK